jgi:hypothetical protein
MHNKNKKLPVYVFIHGQVGFPVFVASPGIAQADLVLTGNFNGGDKSEYNGGNLVRASIELGVPIIYVAINYRLSFLGFPTGEQLSGSYNLGLLDQNLALQWVKNEIKYFGGDPAKVSNTTLNISLADLKL